MNSTFYFKVRRGGGEKKGANDFFTLIKYPSVNQTATQARNVTQLCWWNSDPSFIKLDKVTLEQP